MTSRRSLVSFSMFAALALCSSLAWANLPSVCVQAQQAFQQSQSFTQTTIQSHNKFKQSWQQAFQTRKTSQTFYSRALSDFTSSKSSYSATKSHLASKGFSISSSSSLKSLLSAKGFKFNLVGNKFKFNKIPKLPGAGSSSAQKTAPFDTKQVAKTAGSLLKTSASLSSALSWLKKALTQLRDAKNLGNQAKSQTTSAKQYLANTKSLLQRCQTELQKLQSAPKKRHTLLFPRTGVAYCGNSGWMSETSIAQRVFCAPCDPMRSSCENTCFFGNFGSMFQQTQNQESQLNQAEKSSGSSGNVMFEIDMKIAECEKDEQSTQGNSNETKDQLGSLGF